jgi:tetratricopeptide (TPR) repeat protein
LKKIIFFVGPNYQLRETQVSGVNKSLLQFVSVCISTIDCSIFCNCEQSTGHKMPTMKDYYRSMSKKDQTQFATAAGITLLIGGLFLWIVFHYLQRKFGDKAKGPTIPRSAHTEVQFIKGEPALTVSKERRRIPRAAQATIVERGNRLMTEKKYDEALTCFLALLYSAVDSEDKVLPTQLTECLRGVGQCYIGLGKSDIGLRFLQAERRVFEEMVVEAAKSPGDNGHIPQRSIIASLLGKKDAESVPKRCYTLGEVADACAKLGHHDIALAYRVKAAALRSRMSGEPLDPESEEAALLAQSLNAFQSAREQQKNDSSERELRDTAHTQLQQDVLQKVEQLQSEPPSLDEPHPK